MKAHKYAEMIKAKAENMDLVVLRKHHEGDWIEVADQSEIRIKQSGEYFLCLPQHKEVTLNALNGGEVQYKAGDNLWMECVPYYGNEVSWSNCWWYMLSDTETRIKPRKEKRWIVVNPDKGLAYKTLFKSKQDAVETVCLDMDWQLIEIEVEV
ncbi:hypothetical protein phiV208_71 [Vibrio phage phiV208]|nr:hypothetical protein phiV208_71 [Vibrio phage phiV208]